MAAPRRPKRSQPRPAAHDITKVGRDRFPLCDEGARSGLHMNPGSKRAFGRPFSSGVKRGLVAECFLWNCGAGTPGRRAGCSMQHTKAMAEGRMNAMGLCLFGSARRVLMIIALLLAPVA